MTLQHVVGTASLNELGAIASQCISKGTRLTLLGYKEVGRGAAAASFQKNRQECETGWIAEVKNVATKLGKRWFTIGVDTALAALSKDDIDAIRKKGNECPFSIDHREGVRSMYVDAVSMSMSQSSYIGDQGIPFDKDWFSRWEAMNPVVPKTKPSRRIK